MHQRDRHRRRLCARPGDGWRALDRGEPDGYNVYATAVGSDAVLVFDRSPATGVLTPEVDVNACVSNDGTGDNCVDGRGLDAAASVAVSPDGRNVYVAASGSSAVSVFDRDSSGVLTQKAGTAGCINETGGDGCTDGIALFGVTSVAVSPDGYNVYAAARASDAVVIFDRNPATGALTQKLGLNGCVSEDGTVDECVNGVALDFAWSVAVSSDGRNVYVVSDTSGAVAIFDRNLSNGVLTQKAGTAGCISEDGTASQCVDGVAVDDPFLVTVSPDGRSVYVAGGAENTLAVFDRDTATGALTQRPVPGGCIGQAGVLGCAGGIGLGGVHGVAVSADGRHVYAASSGSNGVAAFRRDFPVYDIDGDEESDALTDGLLLQRYLFGFTAGTLINNAVDLDCTRCTAPLIEAFIAALLAP